MKYLWRLVYCFFFVIFIVPLCVMCLVHEALEWMIEGLCKVEDNLVERGEVKI